MLGEFDRRERGDGRIGGRLGQCAVGAFREQVAQRAELRCDAAGFIDRGVVIVGGLQRQVFIAAGVVAPVGAAEDDVVTPRGVVVEQRVRPVDDCRNRGIARGDGLPPAGEPGGVNFRGVNGEIAGGRGGLVVIGLRLESVASTEAHRRDNCCAAGTGETAGIADEQRHFEIVLEDIVQRIDVAVAARGAGDHAEFVFNLHHDERPALGDLQIGDFLSDAVDVAFRPGDVLRIVAANFHAGVFRFRGPVGNAAIIDFRAAVGTGAQNDPQAVVLADFAHAANIIHAGEIELAFLRFGEIPEQIEREGIEPHRFGLLDAGFEIFGQNAAKVHFAGDQESRLAIDEELFVLGFELVRLAVGNNFGELHVRAGNNRRCAAAASGLGSSCTAKSAASGAGFLGSKVASSVRYLATSSLQLLNAEHDRAGVHVSAVRARVLAVDVGEDAVLWTQRFKHVGADGGEIQERRVGIVSRFFGGLRIRAQARRVGSAAALLGVRSDDDGSRSLGLHLCRPVFENGLIIGIGIGMHVGPVFIMIVGGPHRVVAAGLHVVVAELHEHVVALFHQRHHLVPALFELESFQRFARFGEVGDAHFVVEPAREHLAPTAVRLDRLIGDGGIAAQENRDRVVNLVDVNPLNRNVATEKFQR